MDIGESVKKKYGLFEFIDNISKVMYNFNVKDTQLIWDMRNKVENEIVEYKIYSWQIW